jgi:thiamine-monophosphate kinase
VSPAVPLNGEDRLLRWLRGRFELPLLGDDAAILPAAPGNGPFAVTTDSQVEAVHFVPGLDPAVLARRLLAINLSDLAAMGAAPAYALLALSAAPGFDHRRFFRAFVEACRRFEVTLAGGDLSASPAGTVATLTLLGTRQAPPSASRWVSRGAAEPGHDLWLGGTVGESAAGQRLVAQGARIRGGGVDLPPAFAGSKALLAAARRAVRRHLSPTPQLELGAWLARQQSGAAMDVSDGVARDLHRLCRESGAGAEVLIDELPLAARFHDLCDRLGEDPLRLALGGGEDYVLLFTLPAGVEPPASFGCRRIGRITDGTGVFAIDRGKSRRPRRLPAQGWDHLSDPIRNSIL